MEPNILDEHVICSISTGELERRWGAIREVMNENKVDFLITQSLADYLGGYVKWFTDVPATHTYPVTLIFPRNDDMILISHGSSDSKKSGPPAWMVRGVKKRLSSVIMLSLNYTCGYEAEKVVEELSGYHDIRVGFLNEDSMTAGLVNKVRKGLPSASFIEVTNEIDRIKAIKSPEEIERIKESAYIHDEAMKACLEVIKPGIREFEIAAAARMRLRMLGSEQQFILIGSAPAGKPAAYSHIHAMNRVIQDGDQVGILIEANDSAGYYTHLHRTICVGKIPQELQDDFAMVLEAQNLTINLLKPGADPQEMLAANNAFMREHNVPEETRIYAHAQGYDLLERPSFQPGEMMKIEAGMNIAVHPEVITKGAKAQICDNYIVTETGVSECLHKTPKIVFQV
jgi:Xaa-Pro aminopeptidase